MLGAVYDPMTMGFKEPKWFWGCAFKKLKGDRMNELMQPWRD